MTGWMWGGGWEEEVDSGSPPGSTLALELLPASKYKEHREKREKDWRSETQITFRRSESEESEGRLSKSLGYI